MNKDTDKKIKELAGTYGLELVLLFGSSATGTTHAHSDLDVAFLADKKVDLREQARIARALAEVFKRTDIDVVDLRSASPLLMKHVALGSTIMYESARSVFNEFYLHAMRMYDDARVLLDVRRSFLDHKVKEYSHA